MRVQPVNLPPVNRIVPTVVNPVRTVTQAPKSGIRPEDLNKLLRMSTYDHKGRAYSSRGMVTTFSELFSGSKIDTKA